MRPGKVLGYEKCRAALFGKYMPVAAPALIMSDTRECLDFLAAQPDVRPGPIGTTGYCMGGALSLRAAGTYSDEIAAPASYHGGKPASDAPDCPHLLAAKIQARACVAGDRTRVGRGKTVSAAVTVGGQPAIQKKITERTPAS